MRTRGFGDARQNGTSLQIYISAYINHFYNTLLSVSRKNTDFLVSRALGVSEVFPDAHDRSSSSFAQSPAAHDRAGGWVTRERNRYTRCGKSQSFLPTVLSNVYDECGRRVLIDVARSTGDAIHVTLVFSRLTRRSSRYMRHTHTHIHREANERCLYALKPLSFLYNARVARTTS